MKGVPADFLNGFVLGDDGKYHKKKTSVQPRDNKVATKTVARLKFSEPVQLIDKIEVQVNGTDAWYSYEQAKAFDAFRGKDGCWPGIYFKNATIDDVYADADKNNYIFIKGNVPSSKNSKQLFKNKKTGKNFITSSALCKKYIKNTEMSWTAFRSKFLSMIEGKEKPYRIQFVFIRDKHKAFDYINIAQLPLDLMQEYEWLPVDDNRTVIPDFNAGYGYDPKLAGMIIKVL